MVKDSNDGKGRPPSGAIGTGGQEWLRVDKLSVDHRYQQPLSPTSVRLIAEHFDPDALNVLTVSRRANGKLVLLDGQQRQGALLQMGWGDQLVPCMVYEGLDVEQEAALFTKFNVNRKKPHPVHIFKARVVAGETEACAIEAIMRQVGVRVASSNSQALMTLTAISSVETIHRVGGHELLTWALKTAVAAWEGQPKSLSGNILLGLAVFHKTFPTVSRTELVKKLVRTRCQELESKGRQLKAIEGGNSGSIMGRVLVAAYNHRRAENAKLDAALVPAKFRKSGFGDVKGPSQVARTKPTGKRQGGADRKKKK